MQAGGLIPSSWSVWIEQRQRAAVLSIPRDLSSRFPITVMGGSTRWTTSGAGDARQGRRPGARVRSVERHAWHCYSHWVRFELTGFESIVDAVGGVTVNLGARSTSRSSTSIRIRGVFHAAAGEVHMDGETPMVRASEIERERYWPGESPARQFLWALRDQTLKTNLLRRFPEL